jgi:DNA-binding IclR family transcriptional regulator
MIGSVQRALDILNLFNSQAPELGTTEIAEALKLHKSTTAGLVQTLQANGYLEQNPATRKYRLGLRLLERASVVFAQVPVRQIALPHLQQLRDQFDESVNLAVRDGREVVYIERVYSTKTLFIRTEIGKRAPVHATALGKAILACLPQEQVQTLVQGYTFVPTSPNTLTDPERFLQELDQTREQGYAVDNEEYELGGRCVAAPIFDHTGQAIAGVSLSVPAPRLPVADIPRFGQAVRETARAISRSLGYVPRSF